MSRPLPDIAFNGFKSLLLKTQRPLCEPLLRSKRRWLKTRRQRRFLRRPTQQTAYALKGWEEAISTMGMRVNDVQFVQS